MTSQQIISQIAKALANINPKDFYSVSFQLKDGDVVRLSEGRIHFDFSIGESQSFDNTEEMKKYFFKDRTGK